MLTYIGSNPLISHHKEMAVVIVVLIIFVSLVFAVVVYRHFAGQMSYFKSKYIHNASVTYY